MSNDLSGKKILVTGASTGIGAATAKMLGLYGAHVGVHYGTSHRAAQSVVDHVLASSGHAFLLQADLLDPFQVEKLISEFNEIADGIDVLINNAGAIYGFSNFADLDIADWDHTFQLNVRAPFLLMRYVFEIMKSRDGGRIVNISSNSAKFGGGAENMHYAASKAALDSLTVGMARQGAPHGILVNSIRCGLIETPMQEKIPGYNELRLKERANMIPVKRMGVPEDIAEMVVYLSSPSSSFITGQIIPVTGGE